MSRQCANTAIPFGHIGCVNSAVPGSKMCRYHGGRTPPGLIGLPCGEIARYSDFTHSLLALRKPPGTAFMKATGLGTANPLNAIGRAFIDNPEYEWLFLCNDDNLFPVDTIYRLLDHDVDVVSGLYFGRIQPFEPILFDSWEMVEFNTNGDKWKPGDGAKTERRWWNRHLMATGEQGLIKASAVGDGCLLIKRKVMETIPPLWWEYGISATDSCDHDVNFSQKVIDAGFGLYCDLDLRVDHIAQFIVRPARMTDGSWQVHLVQGDGRTISLPAAYVGMEKDVQDTK